MWEKCAKDKATDKHCNYLSAALSGRLNELKTVYVPEYYLGAFRKDAQFMKDFGNEFIFYIELFFQMSQAYTNSLGIFS